MMHAASPPEMMWTGELLLVDTEAMLDRRDTNWRNSNFSHGGPGKTQGSLKLRVGRGDGDSSP
jgi:hypothetical protein